MKIKQIELYNFGSYEDKVTFDLIKNKTINDTNIIEHLFFKIDKDMKCHIFIK